MRPFLAGDTNIAVTVFNRTKKTQEEQTFPYVYNNKFDELKEY